MDPAVPWTAYAAAASYNRLANATGGFQAAAGEFQNTGLAGHQGSGQAHTTTNQLLLQAAAHTTAATLAGQLGQTTTFNPGGFLSPPPVGYDTVFSPLFHHANPKPAHSYTSTLNTVSQHRQALANAVSAKQSTTESELSTLRENYSQAHHQTNPASYFDHQNTSGSPSTWSHQSNSQLPSPFGILPHESVVASSPGPTKSTTSNYENTFNAAHFAAQSLNHINSQLSAAAEYSKSNAGQKSNRSHSPAKVSSANAVVSSASSTFFQTTFAESNNYQKTENYTVSKSYGSSGSGTTLTNSQQTCIVSTASSNNQNTNQKSEYRIPQPPTRTSSTYLNQNSRTTSQNSTEKSANRAQQQNFVSPPTKTNNNNNNNNSVQTKAQTKIYPELSNQNERRNNSEGLESSQSSPISFALSYSSNKTVQQRNPNTSQYIVNQNYRYNENDYHSRKTGSADSAYSSGSNNGPECNVAVPRRPSPLQAHSQASPLGHVQSPAYPMYNSPLASMSSPSNVDCQTNNNYKTAQVTPPSPLDVTVSRSQNSVAYPSVITRAENSGGAGRQQAQIWESDGQRQNQNRTKFQNQNSNYSLESNQQVSQQQQQQQQQRTNPGAAAVLNITERQQAYFDSTPTTHNTPLQDLTSCRGDPMSIVKNLHSLQNCNSVTNNEQASVKSEESVRPVKNTGQKNRRKSNEKLQASSGSSLNDLAGAAMAEYITSRVPPPAHHNTQSQQQQNGAYLEFERWSLPPPPPSKMFSGSHGTNFGSPAHQHQSLMVPHPHHPPPPLPYFPAFHIPPGHHPHHPQEYHPSIDISPLQFNENAPTNSYQHHDVKEENPKVIVPDIEEELQYLSQTAQAQAVAAAAHNQINLPPPIKMPERKTNDPNSGFMGSYLKFLQGERDTSPPPQSRGNRKQTWSRTKLYTPEIRTNNATPTTAATSAAPGTGEAIKKGNEKPYNPDDDPRFYPLPKSSSTKRKLTDSDSSDDEDGDDSKSGKTYIQMTNVTTAQLSELAKSNVTTPTATAAVLSSSASKKQARQSSKTSVQQFNKIMKKNNELATVGQQSNDPLFVPPRREVSRRKAKDKTTIKNFLEKQSQGDEDLDADDPDFVDSDTDPVWMPGAKGESDEEGKVRKKKCRSLLTKQVTGKSRKHQDDTSSDEDNFRTSKKSHHHHHHHHHHSSSNKTGAQVARSRTKSQSQDTPQQQQQSLQQPAQSQITSSTSEGDVALVDGDVDTNDSSQINKRSKDKLKEKDKSELTGEFVVMKTDLHEEYPPIWRIDGKTLLQKYEPFDENGKTLYRNISTYSGWTPQNRHIYVTVPVRFRVQSRMETIVEFMRDEMTMEDPELMERVMRDLEKYQDSFEVYIQTLISQALDSNFLTEILQEQDDYFLSNVKTIDEVTEDHCRRLLSVTKWRQNLIVSVRTWPCLNIIQHLSKDETFNRVCVACDKPKVSMRIQMYGQPYNSTTLEGCQPDPKAMADKDFLFCTPCGWRISLCSKAAHQKYLMYIECAKRVAEKRASDPSKDTTFILNELLADEAWLNQLFLDVRTSWAEIEKIEHLSRESNKLLLQNAVASAGIS